MNMLYSTSANTQTWSSPEQVSIQEVCDGPYFSVYFDGTYLYYVLANGCTGGGNSILFRRGTPNSDGSITWSGAEQLVATAPGTGLYLNPTVSVDTKGYAWVTYAGGETVWASKDANKDGTWSSATGFPYGVYYVGYGGTYPQSSIYQLKKTQMAVVYTDYYSALWVTEWDGSEFLSACTLSGTSVRNKNEFAAVSSEKMLYIIWRDVSGYRGLDFVPFNFTSYGFGQVQVLVSSFESIAFAIDSQSVGISLVNGTSYYSLNFDYLTTDGSDIYAIWNSTDSVISYTVYRPSSASFVIAPTPFITLSSPLVNDYSIAGMVSNPVGPTQGMPLLLTPYAAALGYQTFDNRTPQLEGAKTYVIYHGSPSALGSSTVGGGLSMHVDSNSKNPSLDNDYVFEMYANFRSDGSINVSAAVYSACAGVGFACGPLYGNCNQLTCKVAFVKVASASVIATGTAGDEIGLRIRWNSSLGWIFDYQNVNLSSSWYAVLTLYPSGNYYDISTSMRLGDVNSKAEPILFVFNEPVDRAYYFQVGFTFSSIPTNANWRMDAYDTQYVVKGGGPWTLLDHALTMTWSALFLFGYPILPVYFTYWKELWAVSLVPAQASGVSMFGSSTANANDIYTEYTGGTQSGNVQLW